MAKPESSEQLFDIMWNCRSMRRLKPDPIPEETLKQLIDAAIHGPSGSNAQNWAFVVVRDPALKKKIGEHWKNTWGFYRATIWAAPARPGEDLKARERMAAAGTYMVDHMHEVPAIIFVGVRKDEAMAKVTSSPSFALNVIKFFGVGGLLKIISNLPGTQAQAEASTAYPAVQNLLLAARTLGLGAVLTTPHLFIPGVFEKLLGIPKDFTLYAVIPVGYPKGKFGPVSRPDVNEVIHWDRHGG
jgi:nitroreductase